MAISISTRNILVDYCRFHGRFLLSHRTGQPAASGRFLPSHIMAVDDGKSLQSGHFAR
jgi:hypothetical protein